MSQAAIPFSFESYLQAKLTAGETVNMNRIVLVNIPNLDITQPIDRNEILPDGSQIVYEQDVDQVGKVNTNSVVYSIVMDTTVGDFDFNAMYLIDKNERTAIGMIVHKELETKTATDNTSGVQGNSLVKSMLMQFDGAAAATNINVDAQTWQIDYSARLKGMDEDVRIQALDIFGHDAFIADGFNTTKSSDTQYFVESGEAYIGGLKAILSGDVTVTVNSKPMFIYAVVNRQGAALSAFANTVEIQTSQTELDDYINGGVNYYVSKIATINADGSVTDERKTSLSDQQFASLQGQLDDLQQQIDDVDADLQGHKAGSDPHHQYVKKDIAQFMPYNPNRIYSLGEVCYTITDGKLSFWEWYSNAESLANKNPLDDANRQLGWLDDSKPFYWTPYKKSRPGSALWPWMSMTFPEGTLNVIGNSVPKVVFWRLAEAFPEFINGDNVDFPETGGEFFRVLDQGRGVDDARAIGSHQSHSIQSHQHPLGAIPTTTINGGQSYPAATDTNAQAGVNTYNTGGSETRPRNIAFPILVEV